MFVAAYHDRYKDRVLVWERDPVTFQRKLVTHKAPHYFYVPDRDGLHEALTGEKLRKIVCTDSADFNESVLCHPKRFESDLSPLDKVLIDLYANTGNPKLVTGFIDIEVDYKSAIGFAGPANPYAPINAVTLYRTDVGEYFTIAIPPPGWNGKLTEEMESSNYFLVTGERELLTTFLDLIEEVDVLSGWNSEFFDVPYIGKRIELMLGQHAMRRLSFDDAPVPRWGERDRFKGSKEKDIVLEMSSRQHLDYMRLFKKFNLEGRQSFALAAIADAELDIPKLHYEGTLEQLYNNDFIHFLLYNRRDTEILVQLDAKFKYIELANTMIHEACVNFDAIFGSVHLIDNAIINFCHNTFKKIVFDRGHGAKHEVEGALVMTPRIGLTKWIGACDINSLYPTTYRSLNLSPEKVVGQLLEEEEGWRAVYEYRRNPETADWNRVLHLQIEGSHADEAIELTVKELSEMLTEKHWAISGFGTILDQSNGEGLIPAILTYWFKGRKEMQAKKKEFLKKADAILKENGGNKEDPAYVEAKTQSDYFDMVQGVRKVLLNSLYGATLNQFMRFFDHRLGASTTGSGRQITTHMVQTTALALTGEVLPLIKTTTVDEEKGTVDNEYCMELNDGPGPIYGDTDSVYFTMDGLVSNEDEAIACADGVNMMINESFPIFMREAFNCQPGFDDLVKANREIVASTGIFSSKKKYMLKVIDLEGRRIPEGDDKELKTMGSDIKLSSTPEAIRAFLKEITLKILRGHDQLEIDQIVMKMRQAFGEDPSINILDFATVTSVKKLEEYWAKWNVQERAGLGRVNLPSNVRATINHNYFIKQMGIKDEQEIRSGAKIKIVWLVENEHGFTNMALSSDTDTLPEWFNQHFQVDRKLTEEKLIDGKLTNIFKPIGWQVPTVKSVKARTLMSF